MRDGYHTLANVVKLQTGVDLTATPGTLEGIANLLESHGLTIYKKKIGRKQRPRTSVRCTPELAEEIRADWNANPGVTVNELALKHNVSIGRVSEAINHLR